MKSYPKPRQPSGTGLPCFHPHPDGAPHCTLPERHKGPHYHYYSQTEWPSRGPQDSALTGIPSDT